jgi:hypothetical protein
VQARNSWSQIPPEVWAIRQGARGALVLEERLRIQPREIETTYRARIFSEEGRAAAELADIPQSVSEIRGRTVYPDGREVTFDSRKDFAERKVEASGRTHSSIHLIVPGVTTDCVIEVQWRERSDGYLYGLPKRLVDGLYGRWWLGNACPTERLVVEIAKNHPFANSILENSRFKAEIREVDGFRVLTYRNLPAWENPPYSLYTQGPFPRLEVYWQPDNLIRAYYRGRDAYWLEAFDRIYKEDYEESVDMGREFLAFSESLLKDLPEAPHAKAAEILVRLDSRIRNVSSATASEKAALPRGFWGGYEYKKLDRAVSSGLASARGMRLLCYHLLKKAGLQPRIGKVVDRERDRFDMGRLNPWQFDHDLLGVSDPVKGVLWLDPTNRFATPGVIHPDYQGTPGLAFEPSGPEGWKVSRAIIPVAEAPSNSRTYTYLLHLGDESDSFEARASFTGYLDYSERARFLPLEPSEQTKSLKGRFEGERKSLLVSKAEVADPSSTLHAFGWKVEGTLEREGGRQRKVEPFPGMAWPLWVPAKLEEQRSMPIVLPQRLIHRALCTFEVPPGFRIADLTEFRNHNRFGSVQWSIQYDEATRKATVQFVTEVATSMEGSEQWRAFKAFLGWIEEACRRTIVLTREG